MKTKLLLLAGVFAFFIFACEKEDIAKDDTKEETKQETPSENDTTSNGDDDHANDSITNGGDNHDNDSTTNGDNGNETEVELPSLNFNGTILYVYPEDNSEGIQWYNGSNTTIGASYISDGKTNTSIIVANQGAGNYAAQVCHDLDAYGYNDWYLPAKDELNALYQNRDSIGGFGRVYYWSSTESNLIAAYLQYFDLGNQVETPKSSSMRVRCVRRE